VLFCGLTPPIDSQHSRVYNVSVAGPVLQTKLPSQDSRYYRRNSAHVHLRGVLY